MASISSLGIGSGLDLNKLLTQLTDAESIPLKLIKNKHTAHQAKLSAYGTVKSVLGAFQGAAKKVSELATYSATKASVGNSDVMSVSTGANAVAGSYSVDVTSLAKAQSLVGSGQASLTAAIGTGTLTFDFGTVSGFDETTGKYVNPGFAPNEKSTKTVTIEAGSNSLQGIRDAINKANIGVTASIVNDGSDQPYRLVLTSDKTGAASSMRISGSSPELQNLIGYDPASTTQPSGVKETVRATNATLSINGIAVSSQSNTVTDAAQGVTMTLNKTGTTSLSVSRDIEGVKASIQGFVAAYNNLQTVAGQLTAFNAADRTSAALTGDGVLRNIQNRLRSILNSPQPAGDDKLTRLAEIGVSFQKDGTMAVDDTKLTKALNDNLAGVTRLFAGNGTTGGYGRQISSAIDDFNSDKGSLKTATDGLNKTLSSLQKDYDKTQERINANVDRYRVQFTQLDLMMSRMNQTSSYLTQQFNAINNINTKK